ncbi:helix-turn-helix domain-containing protein [Rhodococcus sp. 5G237]
MSIIRGRIRRAEDNFTIMPNEWARDARLTRRARGLLLELLSHREGWEISVNSLVNNGQEGRDAIRKTIQELEEHGYLMRRQGRDDNNRFGSTNFILCDPADLCSVDGFSGDGESAPSDDGFSVDGFSVDGESSHKEDYSSQKTIEEKTSARKRAHALPADWIPDREVIDSMKTRFPNVDMASEHEKFTDHFRSTGKTMKDWNAAWRNWIRRSAEFSRSYSSRKSADDDALDILARGQRLAAQLEHGAQKELY